MASFPDAPDTPDVPYVPLPDDAPARWSGEARFFPEKWLDVDTGAWSKEEHAARVLWRMRWRTKVLLSPAKKSELPSDPTDLREELEVALDTLRAHERYEALSDADKELARWMIHACVPNDLQIRGLKPEYRFVVRLP